MKSISLDAVKYHGRRPLLPAPWLRLLLGGRHSHVHHIQQRLQTPFAQHNFIGGHSGGPDRKTIQF